MTGSQLAVEYLSGAVGEGKWGAAAIAYCLMWQRPMPLAEEGHRRFRCSVSPAVGRDAAPAVAPAQSIAARSATVKSAIGPWRSGKTPAWPVPAAVTPAATPAVAVPATSPAATVPAASPAATTPAAAVPAAATPAAAVPAAAAGQPPLAPTCRRRGSRRRAKAAATVEAATAVEAAEAAAHGDHLVRRGLIGLTEQDRVRLQDRPGRQQRRGKRKDGSSGCGPKASSFYQKLRHLFNSST